MLLFMMVSLVCCIKVFHSLDGIDFEDRGQLELNGLKPKFAKPTIVPVEYLQQSNQDYHVRIQVGDVFIDKQVPLCLLQSSRFNELFIIHLDVNGQIYHFDYHVNADECIKRDFNPSKNYKFKSQILVEPVKQGPLPVLKKLVIQDTETKQEQTSFLLKYWYIFLPLAIISFFGGQAQDENKDK